jgi:hypothetical protein
VTLPNRLLPHDPEAEALVLAACLRSREALDVVAPMLRSEHFYEAVNAMVYGAVAELHTSHVLVDVVTVARVLRDRGQLAAIENGINIHRANTFTLIIIDDFSRYGVDEGGERADFVIAAFEEAVARHGSPEMVMSDKGAAFWSWKGVSRFTALLTELGIDHLEAEHKEWNGKVEVFNANLHKELFDAHRFYGLAEMRRRLAAHLSWYNHARTHHALAGLLVPRIATTAASTASSRASRRASGATRTTCSICASDGAACDAGDRRDGRLAQPTSCATHRSRCCQALAVNRVAPRPAARRRDFGRRAGRGGGAARPPRRRPSTVRRCAGTHRSAPPAPARPAS